MKADDLTLDDLLSCDLVRGKIHLADQRAVIFDATLLGLLRRQLIDTFGLNAARGILTRVGYATGWHVAKQLNTAIDWDDDTEWQAAVGPLQRLQGLVAAEIIAPEKEEGDPTATEAIWRNSVEAEQHLLHLGQAEQPVCWTLCGFASGYLCRASREEIYCLEAACAGSGAATCRVVAKTRRAWGSELDAHLPFYERDCLDEALGALQHELKGLELKRRKAHQALGDLAEDDFVCGIVTRSAVMKRLLASARRVAAVDSTVLIRGESGVGKERIARYIHYCSERCAGPFVATNCGSLAPTLLESELFGHAEGAFSGAAGARRGLLEAAKGGILYLDEVDELPLDLQVRLLRVLQEKTCRRLGEEIARPIDLRVIAASQRNLKTEVERGRFREDLVGHLSGVELEVPPLRERSDDIIPLARLKLAETRRRTGPRARGFSGTAEKKLLASKWPGNVRELHKAVERAVIFSRGEIVDADHLPDERTTRDNDLVPPVDLNLTLDQVERNHILAVLAAHNGNKTAAAQQLDIGIATLHRKLKKYRGEGAE